MILRMMKTVFSTFAFCIALSLMLLPTQCLAEDYEIEIAPKVINLSCGGNDFSVHTNIPCGDVDMGDDGEVCLSIKDNQDCTSCCEICSNRSKCDSRGNFVGKFEVEDVVEGLCLEVGSYSLVLSGTIGEEGEEPEPFSAQQIEGEELKVIDNVNSCGASDEKGENRFRKFLGCMQECMQE